MTSGWTCLACERANTTTTLCAGCGTTLCAGCGRARGIATNHAIWDKYPPRTYFAVDAVIAPAPVLRSDLVSRVLMADPPEHDHEPETEDIADGVVGGGRAHVWVTRCITCGEEMEPEEPE